MDRGAPRHPHRVPGITKKANFHKIKNKIDFECVREKKSKTR